MTLPSNLKNNLFKIFQYTEAARNEIHSEIPSQQLSLFFWVALNEGCTQKDLVKHLKMPSGTVSRNIQKLSSRYRKKPGSGEYEQVGYGLIEARQENFNDIRLKNMYLTNEGVRILKILNSKLY